MNLTHQGITAPRWLWDCCSWDRPSLAKPFSDGLWTYATDGRLLMRVARLETVPVTSDAELLRTVSGIMGRVEDRIYSDSIRKNWCMPQALPLDESPSEQFTVTKGSSVVGLLGHRFRAALVLRVCEAPVHAINVIEGVVETPVLVGVGIGIRVVLKPLIPRETGPTAQPSEVSWKHVTPP